MSADRDYVLGTHDDELQRLGLQHRVWRPRVLDAWQRAGFSVGQTILDVGCGPGYATIDLAEIVGPTGKVIAIERSRRFLEALQGMEKDRGLINIEVLEHDLDELGILPGSLVGDGAWCRWVLCFVKRPRDVLAKVASALRPGAKLVLHEYFDYSTWRLAPRCPELEEFVAAVMQSWRSQGGEPDIALSIPRWLGELGLEIQSIQPIVEVVPPTSFVWHWPRSFIEIGMQRLVTLGFFTENRASEILAAVAKAESMPGTLMITPAVLEIIAELKE